jgi:2-polyprenyl-6-methoxyphenol hydroxylase-like FAD-dependent oxidoreductase
MYVEWNKQGSLNQLLEVYKHFSPAVVRLLGKAPPESLKVWKLLDMDVLPTWVRGRLGLLGDAAHPFLPRKSYLSHLQMNNTDQGRPRPRGRCGN